MGEGEGAWQEEQKTWKRIGKMILGLRFAREESWLTTFALHRCNNVLWISAAKGAKKEEDTSMEG